MSRAAQLDAPPPRPAPAAAAPPSDHPSTTREALHIAGWYLLSVVALGWIFPPYGLWPVAFVCLVPWAWATCTVHRAWLAHWLSFAFGYLFFLWSLRWLYPVTGLGYAALAFYLAAYWPLAGWALRTALRRGISPLWTLPVAWVACEYLRGWVMTGFPWLYLSHALYKQLALIQIADLTGAYGVSFLAAMANGVAVEALLQWKSPRRAGRRQWWTGAAAAGALLAGALAYGAWQLGRVDHAGTPELRGPRVAVLQEDFVQLSHEPYGEHVFVILARYLALAAQAAAESPDLVAFPEALWGATQNADFLESDQTVEGIKPGIRNYGRICDRATSAFARGDYAEVNRVLAELERLEPARRLPRLPPQGGRPVTVLVGATSLELFPEAVYPKSKRYNSALVYDADGRQRPVRYDKNHLVPFGEIVPFRYGRFHWLYRQLNALSPFSERGTKEYSMTPGEAKTIFELPTAAGKTRFGVPICYEDTVPHVPRRFVWEGGRRRADFLVNISNDGWFDHSIELPLHLASCVFRAVENRVSIARAVNTGISAFIDPDGRIYGAVEKEGRVRGPGVVGYRVQPVYLDPRGSFYGRYGDWLPKLCLALATLLWIEAVATRWILAMRDKLRALAGRRRSDDASG